MNGKGRRIGEKGEGKGRVSDMIADGWIRVGSMRRREQSPRSLPIGGGIIDRRREFVG